MTSARRLARNAVSVAVALRLGLAWAQPPPAAPPARNVAVVGGATAGAGTPRPALPSAVEPPNPAGVTGATPTPQGATPAASGATAAQLPSVPASASPLNPTPAEFPKPGPAFSDAELDALMARVTALRTRVAALSATLFSSKLRVELSAQSENVRIATLRVSIDGGVVYGAPAQAAFDRPEIVYEHAVAAGPHVIAVEVERKDLRQPQFSTWQTSRFVVVVPEKRLLWTRLELEDESSMGEDFAEDEAGRYALAVRLHVEVSE